MFVHRPTKKVGERTYHTVLLAESYREDGKVKRRTLANMTQWPAEMIDGVEALCQGGVVIKNNELATGTGQSFGLLYALKQLADRHHLTEALGNTRIARVGLLMIFATICSPSSKHAIVKWAQNHAVKEILGIDDLTIGDVYTACNWLSQNQEKIENKLFKLRNCKSSNFYLYDTTSSYFEGKKNKLAAFGYNRDGKRGKLQINYGMLTDEEGFPITIQAFTGNTKDSAQFSAQTVEIAQRFKISKVTFVADRGVMKSDQISDLKAVKKATLFHITALTKPQIQKLINDGVLQLGVFDKDVHEVEHEGKRLVMRRNPIRAVESADNRRARINAVITKIQAKSEKLKTSKRANPSTAYNFAIIQRNRLKVEGFVKITLCDRELTASINDDAVKQAELLDGCYVVQTDLPASDATAQQVHDRYKDLKFVEWAWQKMKTGHLEVRPVFVRKEKITRGHIFLKMLSYYLLRHVWLAVKDLPTLQRPVEESLQALEGIHTTHVMIRNITIAMLPEHLSDTQNLVLKGLGINLPKQKVLAAG
jgi:transposase